MVAKEAFSAQRVLCACESAATTTNTPELQDFFVDGGQFVPLLLKMITFYVILLSFKTPSSDSSRK